MSLLSLSSRMCARCRDDGQAREGHESKQWKRRAGQERAVCYGGLCHAYGRFRRVVAGLSGAAASSGLSSMVMDTWADVDMEWISRSISRRLAWYGPPRQGQPSLFFQGTTAARHGPGGPVSQSRHLSTPSCSQLGGARATRNVGGRSDRSVTHGPHFPSVSEERHQKENLAARLF